MLIKRIHLTIALCLFTIVLLGQVEEVISPRREGSASAKIPFRAGLLLGPDLSLSFGTITYIRLAPFVGYQLTNRLTVGLGPIFIYEKYKHYEWESISYGGRASSSFMLIKGTDNAGPFPLGSILAHIENETQNVERYDMTGKRLWVNCILMGGGLQRSLGERFDYYFYVLWDLTQNKYSPYYGNNPIFRYGFQFHVTKI
jgi:hypothetical protein